MGGLAKPGLWRTWMSELASNSVRLGPNGTNLGLFEINFQVAKFKY